MKVTQGTWVTIRYDLLDQKKEIVESTDDEPVRFRQGDDDILPGLEAAMEGREDGDEFEVTLAPAEAYGDVQPEGIVSMPRDQLPPDVDLEKGDWIALELDPEEREANGIDDDEAEMEMRVIEVHEDEVLLDANHPLAGQEVTFRVKILAVEAD